MGRVVLLSFVIFILELSNRKKIILKLSILHTWITVIVVLILTTSCVNDDSFFPNSTNEEIISSIAVVSLLKNLFSETDTVTEDQQCFRFDYPIILGYNNDSSITVENYSGLISIISGQRSNFNITGLQFPVEVTFKNADRSIRIENEKALLNLFDECGYTSLRDEFENLFRQCFTFDYPVTILDSVKREVAVNTDQEFDAFFNVQNKNYQPDFRFPVDILAGPNASPEKINTYFDFYEVVDVCVGCPEMSIDTTRVSPNTFRFDANFDSKPNLELIWVIDSESLPLIAGENTLTRSFVPGLHKVCLKATSPDCPLGTEVCKEVFAESVCPQLSFTSTIIDPPFTYRFEADFPNIDQIEYTWSVDGNFQEADGGSTGDNEFIFQFDGQQSGKVCIKTDPTPFCPEGAEFCTIIDF